MLPKSWIADAVAKDSSTWFVGLDTMTRRLNPSERFSKMSYSLLGTSTNDTAIVLYPRSFAKSLRTCPVVTRSKLFNLFRKWETLV
jgi:hypothetical protein